MTRMRLLSLLLFLFPFSFACSEAQIKQMEADHQKRAAEWDGFWGELGKEMDKGWGVGGAEEKKKEDEDVQIAKKREREDDRDLRRPRKDKSEEYEEGVDEPDEREATEDDAVDEEPQSRRRRRGRRRRTREPNSDRRSSAFSEEDSLFAQAQAAEREPAPERRPAPKKRKPRSRKTSLFGQPSGDYEQWTIECDAYEGARRQELADKMADLLAQVPELDVDLISVSHNQNDSRVTYGMYPIKYVERKSGVFSSETSDANTELSDEIKQDLDFIRALAIGDQHPFLQARAIPISRPIRGPAEWDLRNARGVYSLHVGVTYATPNLKDYKEAALEWVKVLREAGHEAFYYDDPDEPRVSICVGTFGEDAVRTVLKPVKVKDEKTGKEYTTEEPVQVYAQVVNDMRNRDASFEYNLENGHKIFRRVQDPETKQEERQPNLSFLVKIPRAGEKLGDVKKAKKPRGGGRRRR